MVKAINFDMDGTIADLYGVTNWLDYLMSGNPLPYQIAKPLINLSSFARLLNRLQKQGYNITIISWLSKTSNPHYDKEVTKAKLIWLKNHLPSVKWDNISIVPHGTPKSTCGKGILFDDEEKNRKEWAGIAYDEKNILETLKKLK